MISQTKKNRDHKRTVRQRLGKIAEFSVERWTDQQYRSKIKELYDGPAGAMLALGSMMSLHEPLVGQLFRSGRFDVSPCRNILDIGSGAGQILGHLLKVAEPDAQLVAFDLSHQMLRRARVRMNSDRPSYIVGDMTQMPFADNSFDCVTCGWVIEHLSDPRPGLREIARVLAPDGRLFLLTTEDTIPGLLTSHTWKCRTYNRRELEHFCQEVGFTWCQQHWLTPVHRLFRLGGILIEARKSPPPA